MAIFSKFRCTICGITKQEAHSVNKTPNICSDCRAEIEKQELNDFLSKRALDTKEERLEWCEKQIYLINKKSFGDYITFDA